MTAPRRLTIPRPDDWHLHLRDGAMMRAVLPATALHFARAVVMPNLRPPIVTAAQAKAYRERIHAALPPHTAFTPLMTAYLTDATDPDDLARGFEEGVFFAAKLYPAGATTNAELGVTSLRTIAPILARLERLGMPLLIHGEVADPEVDAFDRETVFIDRELITLRRDFPELRIVLEHVSTRYGVDYVTVEGQNGRLAATITAHHLWINRNALFAGGLRPHFYCLPVAKREEDRQAVIRAATSGAPMFFAGTDSAPHPRAAKEAAKAAGGIFSAPLAVALYAQIFDQAGALDKLADFLCLNGPAFHNLSVNAQTLTLEKSETPCVPPPPTLTEEGADIVPFLPESPLFWRVIDPEPF